MFYDLVFMISMNSHCVMNGSVSKSTLFMNSTNFCPSLGIYPGYNPSNFDSIKNKDGLYISRKILILFCFSCNFFRFALYPSIIVLDQYDFLLKNFLIGLIIILSPSILITTRSPSEIPNSLTIFLGR